jgi:hypothetical protein
MIRIVGIGGTTATAEYHAAQLLRDAIRTEWPEAENDASYDIVIIPNARCFGQKVSEIDILIIGQCPTSASFQPIGPLPGWSGEPLELEEVGVRSVMIVVEVKDHVAADVRFIGGKVQVCYLEHGQQCWHDASMQSHAQAISMANFARSHGMRPPFVRNVIWLRNVRPHEIPPACENVIGANLTWTLLLQTALQVAGPAWRDGAWVLDAFESSDRCSDVGRLFTAEIQPTELDRRRMERLSEDAARLAAEKSGLEARLGKQLIILRGRGGTGKTALLLQMARRLFDRENARVLILTYNHALVADIRRLMALLGISNRIYGRGIHVQTVHSYILEVCGALGIAEIPLADNDGGDAFARAYSQLKTQALEFLRCGLVGTTDIARHRREGTEAFAFDYVFSDEGQDWPSDERDLLMGLYTHCNLVVADGMEQLVRSGAPTDWRGNLPKSEVHVYYRETCLRMKANLARFVEAFADGLGVRYAAPTPNPDAPGGRVIVFDGDYLADRALHDEVRAHNRAGGNAEIDMLFCVPPSQVLHDTVAGMESVTAQTFRRWGLKVWDGVVPAVRHGVPTDLAQHRIVQYDSCRGLEGWTVVALGLDQFHRYKANQLKDSTAGNSGIGTDDLAASWTLIPVTRPMDTLVITLSPGDSPVRTALELSRRCCGDFMEWREP